MASRQLVLARHFPIASLCVLLACGDVTDPNQGNVDADVSTSSDSGTGGGDALVEPDANPACGTCSPFASCPVDTCVCNDGFTGDGEVCSDVNECLMNNGGCSANATCTNVSGGFWCGCTAGFFGDGFTCTPRWAPVYTDTGFNIGYWNYTTGHNQSIYYADSGTFFREYNIPSGNIFAHATSNDFCGCGYTATPVSAGNYIYEFGNYGQRFNGQWEDRSYPDPRGDAGFTVYNGLIFRVGGRTNNDERHLHTYNPTNNTWSATGALADYPWPSRFVGLGGWGNQIFGVAGDTPAGDNKMAVYSIANNTWTVLPDAPFGAYRPHVVIWDNRMFVLGDSGVYVYDPATQAWSPNSFAIPAGMTNAKIVLANANLYVVGDVGANVQISRLNGYEF